jgi:hypothetical protein
MEEKVIRELQIKDTIQRRQAEREQNLRQEERLVERIIGEVWMDGWTNARSRTFRVAQLRGVLCLGWRFVCVCVCVGLDFVGDSVC